MQSGPRQSDSDAESKRLQRLGRELEALTDRNRALLKLMPKSRYATMLEKNTAKRQA
jgi:hypothetical protein